MKEFRQYLAESTKEYYFRIKTVFELDSKEMTRLENHLQKYDAKYVSAPRKTIIQEHPLDFYDIKNCEVNIVDVELGRPVSSYILRAELAEMFDVPEKYIVIRSDNDPLELQNQRLNAEKEMDEDAEKAGDKRESLLSTDSEYHAFEQIENNLFGDEYNKKFMSRMAQARLDAEISGEDELGTKFIASSSEISHDHNEFNKEFDTVKSVDPDHASGKSDGPEVSTKGNLDDDGAKVIRQYKGKKTAKTVTKVNDRIRK